MAWRGWSKTWHTISFGSHESQATDLVSAEEDVPVLIQNAFAYLRPSDQMLTPFPEPPRAAGPSVWISSSCWPWRSITANKGIALVKRRPGRDVSKQLPDDASADLADRVDADNPVAYSDVSAQSRRRVESRQSARTMTVGDGFNTRSGLDITSCGIRECAAIIGMADRAQGDFVRLRRMGLHAEPAGTCSTFSISQPLAVTSNV